LYQKLARSRPLLKRLRDFSNFLFVKKPKAKGEEEEEEAVGDEVDIEEEGDA
jgi:hypothetical protein